MSAADSIIGIHQIAGEDVGPFTRKALRLRGSVTVEDDPDAGEVIAEIATAQRWVSVLDLDLTAEANQNLGADTTYTVGGYTWTKRGTAYELADMQIVNGTGLVICPESDVDGYWTDCTVPALTIRLGDLLVDESILVHDTPIRAMCQAYQAAGPGSLGSDVGVGLDYTTGGLNVVAATRYYLADVATGGQCTVKHNEASPDLVFGTTALAPTYDTPCLWMPFGIGGLSTCYGRGLYGSTWPEIPFLAGWAPDHNCWQLASWPGSGVARDWNLSLFASTANANASYQWVIQRVKLELRY
jgi:hypothetical protein